MLCSFFLLTSCSSHQKTAKHPSLGASNSGIASSEAPCALPSGDVEDVEESTLAEPEQSAKEEIAALDRLGDWKYVFLLQVSFSKKGKLSRTTIL